MGIMVRDGLPVIMVAVGHNRIAVIQAFFDQVDFIAALGTHLMFPETAIGIERKTQYISVTQRPDLGRNAALVSARIIRRDRAVRVGSEVSRVGKECGSKCRCRWST